MLTLLVHTRSDSQMERKPKFLDEQVLDSDNCHVFTLALKRHRVLVRSRVAYDPTRSVATELMDPAVSFSLCVLLLLTTALLCT